MKRRKREVTLRAREGMSETGVCPEGTSPFMKEPECFLFHMLGNVKRVRALTFLSDIVVPFRIVPILPCRKVYPLPD